MIIQAKNIVRTFHNGEIDVHVLKGVDISLKKGEFLMLTGKSGAGKSTLLYQLALLDTPNEGSILIEGVDWGSKPEKAKLKFRLKEFGYVFQDYALLPELTSVENVALPLLMSGISKHKAYEKALEVLNKVGIGSKANSLESQLSGGEKQRVGVARAIVNDPKILFADEPTANLDSENSRIVMDLLKELNEKGQTIVLITHEPEFYSYGDRKILLEDGKVISSKKKKV
jgi:putative ABC transport system ATP-binding protein